jgi:hypothetical protein
MKRREKKKQEPQISMSSKYRFSRKLITSCKNKKKKLKHE